MEMSMLAVNMIDCVTINNFLLIVKIACIIEKAMKPVALLRWLLSFPYS